LTPSALCAPFRYRDDTLLAKGIGTKLAFAAAAEDDAGGGGVGAFYNLSLVWTSLHALKLVLDRGDCDQFFLEDHADNVASLFEVIRKDVKVGRLAINEGEVEELVKKAEQLLGALVAKGKGRGKAELLGRWAELWEQALAARRKRTLSDLSGGACDEDDDVAALAAKGVRFEPTWEAEGSVHRLEARLRAMVGSGSLLEGGLTEEAKCDKLLAELQAEFALLASGGKMNAGCWRVAFRTKKTDPASELTSGALLRSYLSSEAYRAAAQPVVYAVRSGRAAKGLAPQSLALMEVGAGKHQDFVKTLHEKFHAQFRGQDSLDPAQFEHLMTICDAKDNEGKALSKAKTDAIFQAFDTDQSGTIEFQEVVVGLAVLLGDTLEAKLDLLFMSFDDDGNGTMDVEEMATMLKFLNGGNPAYAHYTPPQWASLAYDQIKQGSARAAAAGGGVLGAVAPAAPAAAVAATQARLVAKPLMVGEAVQARPADDDGTWCEARPAIAHADLLL